MHGSLNPAHVFGGTLGEPLGDPLLSFSGPDVGGASVGNGVGGLSVGNGVGGVSVGCGVGGVSVG